MDDEQTDDDKIIIKAENIYKIFGPKPQKILKYLDQKCSKDDIREKTNHTVALNNVSFEVIEGETFVIMGLSGSGKSTLLRCINRLIEPTKGKITIKDSDITAMNEDELIQARRHLMGMVFQNFALLPHRKIIDNVAFGLEIQGINEEERYKAAEEALSLVGLEGYGDSYPDQLSGGMKQRVGLARALASSPDILLMDEAFSALDPLIRRDMQDELIELRERLNKTIIFVTHDLDEALKLGDRIALMKDGKIIQIGTPEEILTNPENAYVERFVEDVDMTRVLSAKDIMKKPEPLVPITAGPNVALHMMKEYGISSVFITGRNRVLEGLILVDDAVRAAKEKRAITEVMIRDIPVIKLEEPVNDIIPMIADIQYPVAVVNDENKIKGIIVRGTVLAAIGRKEAEE
ncbi:quaternary amine ABC transporter ATP-binding protein [Methanoplanus endosymbiosus]|uniref:Glycine betaine/L-proline ABC transporter ATP-binding protein n=1 Tax=Methanoplanus endosymbiosus TaxID=33865 RepID=A0A9E7TGH6_9EURY|nr:glycine betaine/L-proline ABC transporter ATP-binding protein [Methanoplanus endosymbiosus]UUX91152.1 glycine betaine/L-proline ABC transporter ATP-binding protein [Methanoplanus endosymbiosus]